MTPVLELTGVSVCHWRGRRPLQVLQGVSMDLEAGELAGVWAKAGGGKTTLLEVAAGVVAPDEGRVAIDGRDVAMLLPRARRELLHDAIGLATRQGPEVADLPVVTWIELALLSHLPRAEARSRAIQVLERLGLNDVAAEPWGFLSDGERIRAAIARAVVCDPRLLLVDDPTSGLDPIEAMMLLDLLRSLAATTRTAILVTASDMADLQGVDAIWSLVGGHLVGPPRVSATVVDLASRATQM
jgi:putative ABC transport system ATP-binding protein